jgi:hypothetical protein
MNRKYYENTVLDQNSEIIKREYENRELIIAKIKTANFKISDHA